MRYTNPQFTLLTYGQTDESSAVRNGKAKWGRVKSCGNNHNHSHNDNHKVNQLTQRVTSGLQL